MEKKWFVLESWTKTTAKYWKKEIKFFNDDEALVYMAEAKYAHGRDESGVKVFELRPDGTKQQRFDLVKKVFAQVAYK